MLEPVDILKKYWGYQNFRPLQKEIIDSVLSGNDTIALMPTGGGKSLCFQVPAIAKEGLCLVISPLIALMKDQVLNLKTKGIPALSIHSGMNFQEVNKTLKNAAYGNFKFLYVSPERLQSELFLEFLPIIKVNLIAVDEAHCISQWGYDFRPPYLHISDLREYFPSVPFLALTASATPDVQKDIADKLNFRKNSKSFHQSFERANLSYSVFNLSARQNKLLSILKNVKGSGIVYCRSRKRTQDISELLNLNGFNADYYHAGLDAEQRSKKQEDWINNKTRIICCTNAFGMGIDKPDVRIVVHYDLPDALENYYQEAGRAGRNGEKSFAVLFFNVHEIEDLKKQISIRFPAKENIREVYASLCNFLQLPSGSGEGKSFDFDINIFSKRFRLDARLIHNSLKILEQEELIAYSELFFAPSTVVFTTSRYDLEDFEKAYPEYVDVIKGLLRSYEGIFDFPASINESDLSKFISIKKEKVVQLLHQLNKKGIIEYCPQKEKPQIKFIENRVKSGDLFINEKNVLKRKQAYEERLQAIIAYTENENTCRSKIIANYFSGTSPKRCGICDNCLKEKKVILSPKEFNLIRDAIFELVRTAPVSLTEMIKKTKIFPKNKLMKVIDYLQEEEAIKISRNGDISA